MSSVAPGAVSVCNEVAFAFYHGEWFLKALVICTRCGSSLIRVAKLTGTFTPSGRLLGHVSLTSSELGRTGQRKRARATPPRVLVTGSSSGQRRRGDASPRSPRQSGQARPSRTVSWGTPPAQRGPTPRRERLLRAARAGVCPLPFPGRPLR